MNFRESYRILSVPRRYTIALLIFLIAFSFLLALYPIELGAVLITFSPAVLITLVFCGNGPGQLVAVMAALTGIYNVMRPHYSLAAHSDAYVTVATFLFFSYLMGKVISKQRAIEAALLDAQERLNFSFEGSGDGMWDWDAITGEVIYSKLWKAMLGYSETELKNDFKEWEARVHPDDLANAMSDIQSYLDSVTPRYVNEHRLKCKDGSYKWILTRGVITARDPDGNPLRLIGTHTDITAQKNIQQALLIANSEIDTANKELHFQNDEKEQRAAELVIANKELLFQNEQKQQRAAELEIANLALSVAAIAFESQEGMAITDAKLNILRVNQAYKNITGYSVEGAIEAAPHLSGIGQAEVFNTEIESTLQKTGEWAGEVWKQRKNGEDYPAHLSITAVNDVAGTLINYVITLTDITLSKSAAKEIYNLAFYDPLTQLPNRRLLIDRLEQALAASARKGRRGALLFLDLDRFKTINDNLGHNAGDWVLQQAAARLTASVREGDTVSRFGGDEFVVLLEDLNEQAIEAASQARDISKKILNTLNQPYQFGTYSLHSAGSIGITVFNGHEQVPEQLLKQADIAMYHSKSAGRNTLHFFNPVMQVAITARANMEDALRRAIEHNEFQLYYQMQVNTAGQVIGAEGLIRWQRPEYGQISPIDFIALAEETGLIIPIGQWVVDTACAQIKTWQQNPLTEDLVLAVNVNAKQFHQEHFVEQITATLLRYEVNPEKLKLELTESMLINNISEILSKMNALNKLGVNFSLDDFGTGYSSLQYLKTLPIKQLKIDRTFVRDLADDANDQAIVRTIISMVESLGIDVIAEGVENEAQRRWLLDNGCTHFQGYLFSKPLPIEQFENLLAVF
jgi:diguanylate cyclase (GGDEF)-like protein/PAS domain S-box-containing protein